MANSETNKAAIEKNRKTIFQIEAHVMSNKALAYQSRSMIEENRLMILSNYSAAFMGNRQLANANTDEIFNNRAAILQGMAAEGDVQENFVNAQQNKSALDFLRHRSSLNSSVLTISEKLAAINTQLVEINSEIMNANAEIVAFNGEQIAANSEMLNGSLTASSATPESNAQLVAANSESMADLLANVSKNKGKIEELLETAFIVGADKISTNNLVSSVHPLVF